MNKQKQVGSDQNTLDNLIKMVIDKTQRTHKYRTPPLKNINKNKIPNMSKLPGTAIKISRWDKLVNWFYNKLLKK